jgi:DTW domain-containing protein YfiP
MSRETCYRCFWPKALCWCASIHPMPTRTKFVFLMHPKEFKQEKAATGRLTHLCLANSEIHMGIGFDEHPAVTALMRDPGTFPVLLHAGGNARNLSRGELASAELGGRRLVVFLIDATWSCARKIFKLSPALQRLTRVAFTPSAPSRYRIKQQPQEGCLSTLEATHEVLAALERAGLDRYPQPEQLLGLFHRMQDFQIECARDPARAHHHRPAVRSPTNRFGHQLAAGSRRRRFLRD